MSDNSGWNDINRAIAYVFGGIDWPVWLIFVPWRLALMILGAVYSIGITILVVRWLQARAICKHRLY